MSYGWEHELAAQSAASDRATFVRRTYAHLAGAVLGIVALEALLLKVVDHTTVLRLMWGSTVNQFITLVLFIAAGAIARVWARSETSAGLQYLGLSLYVATWAIIALPTLIVATHFAPHTIPQAGILTLAVFGGLTLSVFVTGKDYSFLAPILSVGSMIALGVIVCALLFGFTLGLFFCFAMIALISGYILYDTSNVMLRYRTDQPVAASLELFADVALLFLYVLQICMSLGNRD